MVQLHSIPSTRQDITWKQAHQGLDMPTNVYVLGMPRTRRHLNGCCLLGTFGGWLVVEFCPILSEALIDSLMLPLPLDSESR